MSISVTTWQRERDGLLDEISHLNDCRNRTTEYLTQRVKDGLLPDFEVAEAMLLLWEARDESDRRRWRE